MAVGRAMTSERRQQGQKDSQTETSKLMGSSAGRHRPAEISQWSRIHSEPVEEAQMLDHDALGRPVEPEV